MIVIGLISGTSVDGIDAALVEVTGERLDLSVNLLAGETYPYPPDLRHQILAICGGDAISMAEFAALDDAIAYQFARAARSIQPSNLSAKIIGSHGQTVFHRPPRAHLQQTEELCPLGYSLQVGRGSLIAALTGTTTVSNFRAADIAVGGQGAPLVSPVDVYLFGHATKDRCIQNIGGIGNVTFLPAYSNQLSGASGVRGWDTGPGNMLLDSAVQLLSDGAQTFDADGAWASQGTPCLAVIEHWMQQEFFHLPPPKSTGREQFGADYLQHCLADIANYSLSKADILATLTEFTAVSIAQSYQTFLPRMPEQVVLCGGGSRNHYLKQRLQVQLGATEVLTTDQLGLNADFKEAIAFAVLAYWRINGIVGNLPEVTGAAASVLLGEIHLAPQNVRDTIQ